MPDGQAAFPRAPVFYGPGVRIRIEAGTLVQKLLPRHLVEPYLSSQRSVISGFVHCAEDGLLPGPSWLREAYAAGTVTRAHARQTDDLWVLRWRALDIQTYLAASPAPPAGGDPGSRDPGSPPWGEPHGGLGHPAFELFIAPGPIPVGTEMYQITPAGEEFIARYDGQAWLRLGAGS
ncbi:MAG: hypothetical protein LBV78_19990 [Kitasatospora sp.]|nr:hypothetical protein [Kitasatospora sp.]